MRKIIFVTGDLASGKTTLSETIASRYRLPVIHKDEIKEAFADAIGCRNNEESKKLSELSRQMMALFMETFLKSSCDFVMESNFRKEELDSLRVKAATSGYETLVINLYADIEVLHARYVKRIANGNRHPVHQNNGFEDFETFKSYVEQNRQHFTGNVITVDSTDLENLNGKTCSDALIHFLES